MAMFRLGIVERYALIGRAYMSFFDGCPDFRVDWTAETIGEGLARLSSGVPDAILAGSDLPDGGPFEFAGHVSRLTATARIVVLAAQFSSAASRAKSDTRISGCLHVDGSPQAVLDGLRAILVGSSAEALSQRNWRLDQEAASPSEIAGPNCQKLTTRQMEILQHLAEGASAKEVARRLHLSAKSVESHAYRIKKLLNLRDRVDLVRFAIREGLISP